MFLSLDYFMDYAKQVREKGMTTCSFQPVAAGEERDYGGERD